MNESNQIYTVAASIVAPIPDGNEHFPLENAYLCSNCNAVGNNSNACPACADATSLMRLSKVLNRGSESVDDY